MVMVTLEEQMAQLDARIRVWSMPAHLAKAITEGERAQAEHERQKKALLKERAEIAEAMAKQVSAADYQKRKAEREERDRQIAAAEAALREAADEYAATYAALVANLQAAADGVGKALAQMRVIGQLGTALSLDGRVPHACNTQQLESDIAMLVAAAFKTVPGHKFRLGALTWPSAADAHYQAGADWAGKERARVLAQIVAPLTTAEG
jgi:hypothetical protein